MQDPKGPVVATLALILINFVLGVAGEIPHLNFWQILLALFGMWLFGAYIERRLGSIVFILVYLALAIPSGFLVGSVDDVSGRFAINLFLPVLALGLIHLALAPRSKILTMVPIPYAMAFYEVPTVGILVIWAGLEVLLTAL
ncbi:MAG: rhomboid family intramembrane serine protease [Solirubrobacterales bacterium]